MMPTSSLTDRADAPQWHRIRTVENRWARNGLTALAVVYLVWSLATLDINWARVGDGLPRAA
ncbi:MAG: phnE, partial [candidate division NC10 bacterium]|nr:phnE [candidate division NC10 bacterium]